jgi:hypothetical protein
MRMGRELDALSGEAAPHFKAVGDILEIFFGCARRPPLSRIDLQVGKPKVLVKADELKVVLEDLVVLGGFSGGPFERLANFSPISPIFCCNSLGLSG